MTIEQFIEENRSSIDQHVYDQLGRVPIDDDEREEWILNSEFLYTWAVDKGVDV